MGQRCCSRLTGRDGPVEGIATRPLVAARYDTYDTSYTSKFPSTHYAGGFAGAVVVDPIVVVDPKLLTKHEPLYPEALCTDDTAQRRLGQQPQWGLQTGLQTEPQTSTSPKSPMCCTPRCDRRPWNNVSGELCCRSCAQSSGREHGPNCAARMNRQRSGAPLILGADAGRLSPCGSPVSFDWIRKGNDPASRQERHRAAQMTQGTCAAGSYILEGEKVLLDHIRPMCENTRFITGVAAGGPGSQILGPRCFQHEYDAMSWALHCKRQDLPTALVNAASGHHTGGGFETGGRHALEESLCVQSTLFQSLRVAKEFRGGQFPYIPQDGVVLSPGVEVFRSGSSDGYRFLPRVELLDAVISVAMPNKNYGVRDAPVDAPESREAYWDLLVRKFEAVLAAAACAQVTALVIPDVGCGVFANDPSDVGKAFGEALQRYPRQFVEIHLVGRRAFSDAAIAAIVNL